MNNWIDTQLIDDGLIPLEIIDDLYRPHLDVVADRDGIQYTSKQHVAKLFRDYKKVKSIREQAMNKRLERQNRERISSDDDYVEHNSKYKD